MESRAFIRTATTLVGKIQGFTQTAGNPDEVRAARDTLQKEINQAFTGLQNPTLPSASKLCAAALAAGFTVKPDVQHRLTQADSWWV